MSRVEKQLERIAEQEAALNAEVLTNATDHAKLAEVSARLSELAEQKEELELEWLEASELID
jgi:ATP-binding cassette subfamily F protein uup